MKKLFFLAIIVISTLSLSAQDKTASDFKEEGITAVKAEDYKAAYVAFEKAIELFAVEGVVDTALLYNTGYCAYQNNNFESATKYFEKSIELKYKTEKAYLFAANSYKKLNNDEKYGKTLDSALVYYPDNAKLRKMQGTRYFGEGLQHYNKASEYIQVAANLVQSDPEGFKKNKAMAVEEYKIALPMLEEAYKLFPDIKNLPEALLGIYEGLEMKEQAELIKKRIDEMK